MRQFKGQTFTFCSEKCVTSFDADPSRYASPASATTGVSDTASGAVRIELPVRGLQRAGGPALARTLQAVAGVGKVAVNVRAGRATVDYDPSRANVTDLIDAIRAAGFAPGGQTLRLKVSGLYCAECVGRIERALKAVPGVFEASMSPATNEVKVEYSPAIGGLSLLQKAVEQAGPYKATRAAEASEPEQDKEAAAVDKEYRSLMRK